MALDDLYSNIHLLIRWLHVIAGITWIGILYFFNFINIPLQAALDDAGKKAVNPQLMPRALWWFRWGAMATFVAGIILFVLNYMYTPGVGFGPTSLLISDGGMTARSSWIMMGMLLGTIMWFNVWFLIWPAQKAILGKTASPEQIPALRKRAGLCSKINTYLSGPMLFGMLAPAHYGASNVVTMLVAFALGMFAIGSSYRQSKKVSATV
jgi:uncharacterized membrane protein